MEAEVLEVQEAEQETQDVSLLSDEEINARLSGEPEKTDTVEPVAEETKPEPEKAEAEQVQQEAEEENVTISKTELEKLKKQVQEKQSFIDRQANEVGTLRQARERLQAEIDALTQSLSYDSLVEDTATTLKRSAELSRKEQELRNLDAREHESAVQNIVHSVVPDYVQRIDDILAVMRQDGLPEEVVRAVQVNPYVLHPDAAIGFAKRAEANKLIATLQAELAKAKSKPDTILDNIEKAASRKPVINGKSSGDVKGDVSVISESQLAEMSDKELEEFLKSKK